MGNSLMLFDKQGRPGFEFLVREYQRRDGRVVGIKSGVARMELRESKKEFVMFDRVGHITANGYREINRAAGITIVEPPTIHVEGLGLLSNPHSDIDPETGAWMGGKMRLVAFGRNVIGNMCIADYTNRMTLHSMVNESLLAVRKRRPSAVMWGFKQTSPADMMSEVLLTFNEDIEEEIEEARRRKWKSKEWRRRLQFDDKSIQKIINRAARRVKIGLWVFRTVDPMTGQGLWYDVQDADVAKAFANFSKNDEIGIRKLKGTTYRNVSRDHPATPGMILGPEQILGDQEGQRRAVVSVYFHEQLEDRSDLEELMSNFAAGVEIADATVIRGDGELKPADLDSSDDDEPEETGEAPEADVTDSGGMTDRDKLVAQIEELAGYDPDAALNDQDDDYLRALLAKLTGGAE